MSIINEKMWWEYVMFGANSGGGGEVGNQRFTPTLDGLTNYYQRSSTITLGGDFYFSGYYFIDGSTHFVASKAGSLGRLGYLEGTTDSLFMSATNGQTTLVDIPSDTFATQKVYFIECGRFNGVVKWRVDGTQKGADTSYSNTLIVDSFGTQWGGSTGVPYHSGAMYDITIGNNGETEFFSLDNPFSDYASNIYGDKGTKLTGYNFVGSQITKEDESETLLVNGNFDDTSVWLIQGANSTLTVSNGIGSVASSNFEGIRQSVVVETGKVYEVNWKLKSKVGTLYLRIYDTADFGTLIKEVTSEYLNGYFRFTAQSNNANLYLRNTTAGTTEWDSISLREVL